MRHIISILMQNEAGALVRVAGMFSARGYNIESLSVAPTEDETVSRLTLETVGSDQVINQVNRQTEKLVDVVGIADMTDGPHYERELMLIKLAERSQVVDEYIERYRARVLEDDEVCIVEVIGTGGEVAHFLSAMQNRAEVLEVVRSGVAAIASGTDVLRLED